MYKTSGSPAFTGRARALVREASQRRALPRRGSRRERIDLDHPAEGVGDVAIVVAAVGGRAELLAFQRPYRLSGVSGVTVAHSSRPVPATP